MDNYITRQEHEEFSRRIDAENTRQNRRIGVLEENVKQINALTISVEKMASNMEHMLEAIERQGNLIEKQNNRLDDIEREPAKDQKEIKMEIIKTIVSALVGAIVVAVVALL